MQRTETPNFGSARPSSPMGTPAAQPRRFGFGTGLMAGLLGAGLFGMLTGHGFLGGIGGLLSVFGFLLQIGLIVALAMLAVRFFRRRSEPSFAGAGTAARTMAPPSNGPTPASGGGGFGSRTAARQPIQIGPDDYRTFERNLQEVQLAYGRADLAAIRQLATPEMVRYLADELEDHRARGVRNEVSSPRLLQGDLAEAWREGGREYATVAMRFEILDLYRDIASGRVVSGNASAPTEATEVWTFVRPLGGPWTLSAIQQTA